jgi:predicted oxidoreductase (fatty acid repression mutant protein)
MKCSKSAFNAQGSRVIIIVVQVRGVKIYVTVLEVLRKKERKDENWFTTKIGGKMKVWVSLIWLRKNFILNYATDALLC